MPRLSYQREPYENEEEESYQSQIFREAACTSNIVTDDSDDDERGDMWTLKRATPIDDTIDEFARLRKRIRYHKVSPVLASDDEVDHDDDSVLLLCQSYSLKQQHNDL